MEKQENKEVKTVQEMCEKYEEAKNDVIRDGIITACNVKQYLPIADKIKLIDNLVYGKVGQINDEGLASYSGIDNVVYFMLATVEGYTDLQMDEDDLADFDALSESGLMAGILEAIGPDADMFKDMYEMTLNDFINEHNTLSKYVEICIQAILKPFTEWSDNFNNVIEENGGLDNLLKTIREIEEEVS